MRLSIAIPIYNFANFIIETLESIVAQDRSDEVEIVVVDGASTDATPEVMAAFQQKHPAVRYVRLPAKGGIDRDMATAFASTSGDYCWLFSGDDIMRPGALARALEEIESGCDVYLSKHMEFLHDRKIWSEWPVLEPNLAGVFDLTDPAERVRYFASAVNSEAFFSFMGGMITKRTTWDRAAFNEDFNGSCWGHVARLFELMKSGLKLRYVPETWQDRRPDNDSFAGRGMVKRFALSIDGYHRLADTFFGPGSAEAFHVRRVIRHEFSPGMFLYGKYLCWVNPDVDSVSELYALMRKVYPAWNYVDLSARLKVRMTSVAQYRKWNKAFCEDYEARFRARQSRV